MLIYYHNYINYINNDNNRIQTYLADNYNLLTKTQINSLIKEHLF